MPATYESVKEAELSFILKDFQLSSTENSSVCNAIDFSNGNIIYRDHNGFCIYRCWDGSKLDLNGLWEDTSIETLKTMIKPFKKK